MVGWRRIAAVALGCALAGAGAGARAQALPPAVEAALARTKLPRDAVTLLVAPVDAAAAPRLAHRIDAPVNPASIAKLVTTFAGLELLGPAYSWRTPVYVDGPIEGGVLRGNLYLQGQGDPKLVAQRLWLLMRRVQGLGVQRIAGDIVLDRSAFESLPPDAGAFDGEPLRPYNATPDALLINFKSVVITFTPVGQEARVQVEPPLAGVQWPAAVPLTAGGCGDWRGGLKADWRDATAPRFGGGYPAACGERIWPIAHTDPAGYAARAVAGMWRAVGGSLEGQVRDGRVPAGLAPAFEWHSPPLAEILRDINKFSNNVMARQLFLSLSREARGFGTQEGSREVLRAWWRERFGGDGPAIENGAGLARGDRVTARQLAQLLQGAWRSPLMSELMSSLPIAGLDGTLRRSQGAGVAHLKTGSLRDVAGVAGYVVGASGQRYVLVLIANHPHAAAVRAMIDPLIEWTAADQ
jgi:D-alanyl-D-alanine carboxypeptidase/D-alanyl-D-alanine-endopeptidase (penicillin-binding protein 4)